MDNKQPPERSYFYFLVSGKIEYMEKVPPRPGYKPQLVQGHLEANTIFQSPVQGLTAKHLAKCQQDLQMNFHRHYSRTHKTPPHNITNVTLIATSFLGYFTEAEFLADAPIIEPSESTDPLPPETVHAANAGETSNAQS